MSQSAMPATQNDMTTCLETLEKEKICSFPHRHCEATGKPETRDETRGRKQTSISCETSSKLDIFDTLSNRLECHKVPRLPRKTTWQPAWTHSNRRGFPASPIDTATPQGNQRLDTRHVNAEKPAFRTSLPPFFVFLSLEVCELKTLRRCFCCSKQCWVVSGAPNLRRLSSRCRVRLDMKKEKIVLTDWKYGALKGRSSEPWAECIQFVPHEEADWQQWALASASGSGESLSRHAAWYASGQTPPYGGAAVRWSDGLSIFFSRCSCIGVVSACFLRGAMVA